MFNIFAKTNSFISVTESFKGVSDCMHGYFVNICFESVSLNRGFIVNGFSAKPVSTFKAILATSMVSNFPRPEHFFTTPYAIFPFLCISVKKVFFSYDHLFSKWDLLFVFKYPRDLNNWIAHLQNTNCSPAQKNNIPSLTVLDNSSLMTIHHLNHTGCIPDQDLLQAQGKLSPSSSSLLEIKRLSNFLRTSSWSCAINFLPSSISWLINCCLLS